MHLTKHPFRGWGINVLKHFHQVTTFIFDVDDVLTDNSVLLLENGSQARQIDIKDGLGIQLALKNNYKVFVVSGETSESIINRLQYLGVDEIHVGLKDKSIFLERTMEQYQLSPEEVLYMGDDLPDVDALKKVGLPCCPEDAAMEVKKICKYISPLKGGHGCVRDVIEKVLRLNRHWNYVAGIS